MITLSTSGQTEPQVADIRWTSPDSNLWVATADGEYSGMVEFLDGRFHVRNSTGQLVDSATNVPGARQILENHVRGISPRRARGARIAQLRRTPPAPYRRTAAGAA